MMKHISTVAALSLSFLYCLYFVKDGIGLSDEGFILTQQMLFTKNFESQHFGMVWLSEYLGSLWLQLNPTLYFSRLGWALLSAITVALSCHIFQYFMTRQAAVTSAILVGIIAQPDGFMIMEYNNLPFLFLLMATLFIVQSEKSESKVKLNILAGALIAIAVMAKFSLLTCLVLGFVPFLVDWLLFKKLHAQKLKMALMSLLGFAVTYAALWAWLYIFGHHQEYLNAVIEVFQRDASNPSSTNSLLNQALLDTQRVVLIGGKFLLMAALLSAVVWLVNKYLRVSYKNWVAATLVFLVLLIGIQAFYPRMFEYKILLPSLGLIGFVVAAIRIYRSELNNKNWHTSTLVLALLLMVLIFLGSNNGVRNAKYGLYLILPLSYYFVFGRKQLHLFFAGMIAVAVVSATYRYKTPWRDLPRSYLTASVAHPKLKSIKTNPARANSLNEVLGALQTLVQPGDKMLIYNTGCLLHFLTETQPAMIHSWPTILPFAEFDRELEKLNLQKPKVVVRVMTNTWHPLWGTGQKIPVNFFLTKRNNQKLDQWLSVNQYKVHWQNQDFLIATL